MKEILNVIHNTIYQFFDVCNDDEEVPMSDKDKLLLEVNKAICNNLKSLEQQPCEDCISRQRVFNDLENISKGSEHPRQAFVFVDECVDYITSVPAVMPTRPTGRWIDIQYFKADDTYYRPKCPFCSTEPKEYSNYCPNCGAKMQEVEE